MGVGDTDGTVVNIVEVEREESPKVTGKLTQDLRAVYQVGRICK